MKYLNLYLLALLPLGVNGCGNLKAAPSQKLLYSFVAEVPENTLEERVGQIPPSHIPPIEERTVLLFPVINNGVVNGKRVPYGLGSPVIYKQGDDVNTLQFKGIEHWPGKGYMVWARGYYIVTTPRQFLLSEIFEGQKYTLVELTPIKPRTDQRKMESAIIKELQKGKIIVEDGILNIAEVTDYARLIKAEIMKSWMKKIPDGYQCEMVLWGRPGAALEILLTPDDYTLIESYLRGESPSTNSPAH
jgi:hypothetical protein